jgi:hypothetical protein
MTFTFSEELKVRVPKTPLNGSSRKKMRVRRRGPKHPLN